MIPPPGCVAEPFMYRPRSGVRYRAHPGTGPVEEQLLQRQLALEDVALGQPEVALDVERRLDLHVQDQVADVRHALLDRGEHRLAERVPLVVPRAQLRSRLYGAYWTKHEMMCLPGGAIDGSTSVGMIMSMYGRRLKCPYFASSYARSM